MSDLFDLPFEDDEDVPLTGDAARGRADRDQPPATRDPVTADDRRLTTDRTPIATKRVLTVTELTVRVRDLLETQLFEVWVEGELSNCRAWNTGHLYFTLKDAGAQLRGVVFRSAMRYLKFTPGDGMRVVARGRVSVYEPKGEYQLVCEHMEPQGLGALQLAFEQLKKRLQSEGLFDTAKKRPLPALPRKIGIVTSVSWPTAEITGTGDAAIARATISSLKAQRSSIDPPPRPTMMTSTPLTRPMAFRPRAISPAASSPWTRAGRMTRCAFA